MTLKKKKKQEPAYKVSQFNFKRCEEELENGKTVYCLRTMERITKTKNKITVNMADLTVEEFIRYYKDEVFFTRD